MTAARESPVTGLLGPVAFYAGACLLALAPLMRGGNRYIALIPLELIALVALFAITLGHRSEWSTRSVNLHGVLVLAASPVALAALQLLPVIPASLWLRLPGHDPFQSVIDLAGDGLAWRALSASPEATTASLLAGLPLAACLLVGYFSSVEQFRVLARVIVAVAVLQVLVAALQLGGENAFLMFGANSSPPVGTFGNRNHLGNYLAISLCCWLWLAWGKRREDTVGPALIGPGTMDRNAIRTSIAVVLLVGLLLSKSRAAVMFGAPAAVFGVALAHLVRRESEWYWRWVPALAVLLLILIVWLLGADARTSRFRGESLADAADFRALLARTSLQAAAAFFPFGSGWGTYDLVYPRFQPAAISKFANHAHMDYVEMLVEGGIFFIALAGLFAWLAVRRGRVLWRIIGDRHRASREGILASFCGLGLAVALLHSLVDFNLRIPSNAMLACLLAGSFLRPLPRRFPRVSKLRDPS